MLLNVFWVLLGLALLGVGGELLVRGAVGLSLRLKVTPAVIGLTVVSAGTSMPELVVSVVAALQGSPDVAVANVVGSNIFNIGLVLGTCALVLPLPIEESTWRVEWPFLLIATLGTVFVMRDHVIGRLEGSVLLAAIVIFVVVMIRIAREKVQSQERADLGEQVSHIAGKVPARGLAFFSAILMVGLVLLVLGGKAVVAGATGIAFQFGLSERIVGLTIVAMGTSLPELASSLIAALRGRTDVAVGNVIGSSIFNLLAILGVGGMMVPLQVNAQLFRSDVWWMLGFTLLLVPVFFLGRVRNGGGGNTGAGYQLNRWGGAFLVGAFAVYMTLLVLGRI